MSFLDNKKASSVVTTCSVSEYVVHRAEYNGVCLECGEFSDGGVEPDAEDYACESCGADAVMGVESAVLYGWLAIEPAPMQKSYAAVLQKPVLS